MSDLYIYHHGIQGQRWGIRRYQNPDGSLTPSGRARYRNVEKDVDSVIRNNKETVNSIKSKEKAIINKSANELGKKYTSYFKVAKLNSEEREKVINKLAKQDAYVTRRTGKPLNSRDLKSSAKDQIWFALMDSVPQEIKNERQKLDKDISSFYKDIEKLGSSVINKYQNKYVVDAQSYFNDGKSVVDDLMSKQFDMKMVSYISRHFDDYWVYDTKEFSDAVNRITDELLDYKNPEFRKR